MRNDYYPHCVQSGGGGTVQFTQLACPLWALGLSFLCHKQLHVLPLGMDSASDRNPQNIPDWRSPRPFGTLTGNSPLHVAFCHRVDLLVTSLLIMLTCPWKPTCMCCPLLGGPLRIWRPASVSSPLVFCALFTSHLSLEGSACSTQPLPPALGRLDKAMQTGGTPLPPP